MKQTVIRVTRVIQVKVTEYVDVTISKDEDRAYPDAETLAKDLVEAQIAAGQSIVWFQVASEIQSYPSPSITAAKKQNFAIKGQAVPYENAVLSSQTAAAPEEPF